MNLLQKYSVTRFVLFWRKLVCTIVCTMISSIKKEVAYCSCSAALCSEVNGEMIERENLGLKIFNIGSAEALPILCVRYFR